MTRNTDPNQAAGRTAAPVESTRLSPGANSPGTSYDDNPIIGRLPNHLKQFIVNQRYDLYTPIDHAVWRYVMRQNYNYLKETAHPAYVQGLEQTGIAIDTIPSIEGMNEILGQIGWAAVTVDGFIPPAAFMEFQAHRILVIAADIRQINHIKYTPAPDIIHEAAGHAPIIADSDYAEYLRKIGAVGSKAMSSRKDYKLYEAIRHLSIIKERPDADPNAIKRAEQDVDDRQNNLGEPSEMARLSRMHWWTVEYGLIGSLDAPRIYGAGLLSSIGESANCLTAQVEKLPYNMETADYAFDITTQQPHLFVTPDFEHLIKVLDDFAESMACTIGGQAGLDKAIECANLCTLVYSSGLQVSGIVAESLADDAGQPAFVRISGPAMLSINDSMLKNHDKERYPDGVVAPVGNLKGTIKPIEDLTDTELKEQGIALSQVSHLTFASGIVVTGELVSITRRKNKIILMIFCSAQIRRGESLLFDSGGKTFNLPVGEKIVSVFGGAADQDAYEPISLVPRERTVASEQSERQLALQELYRQVRNCREQQLSTDLLAPVWEQHQKNHSDDWLLALEIVEILTRRQSNPELRDDIHRCLRSRADDDPELSDLITKGLALAN